MGKIKLFTQLTTLKFQMKKLSVSLLVKSLPFTKCETVHHNKRNHNICIYKLSC